MFEGHPFRDAPAKKLLSALIQPRVSRWASFAAIGSVAAIWNGISGWQLAKALGSGNPLFVVLMTFVAMIGLVLLGSTFHAFLAVFNPTVEILASADQPALGEPLELHWRLTGKASRVQRLRIDLEGIEEATYQRGTNTTTDRHPFANLAIMTTTDRAEIASGNATVVFPQDAVPSFTATNNKIVWRLIVHGEIPNWPDIRDEFALDVVAHRRARRKAAA